MFASLLKRTGFALTFAALAATAQAEPVLRGDVTVNAAIVTVGDLFDGAGLMAETAVFRAPAPGTSGILSLEDIAAAVRAAGIETFEPSGFNRIRVARTGVEIGQDLLSDLIAADLRAKGILNTDMDMDIALDAPLPGLIAADTDNPASLTILRYMPGSSTFSARFQVSGLDRPLDISGQIQLLIAAPHLKRTLPQGTILGPDDIEMRMIPLAYAESTGLVTLEEIMGMALQRQSRQGVMLKPSDIAAPEVVSRNEQVTVIFQQGALTLTTTGKALNAASLSQPVSVLNTMTNKVLQGVATQNGTVTVSSGPQQLAGL
ncbi:flagellar basal body P-ring formation chaperone FlgA [Pelagibacterium halotolerans]|uniref:Flagellar basal-body P-ring formation protein FlgA n=1 Tax=Pelagibacterium halotolerans (strain DSM 22347 / JCM 15775 / CGMCC 1.7692 / B2) TaxID=1082931 RepID=G4REB1_PELHB|nr:flagellar basal body P-ring formation chaperone FlgA [Pelagibacterium halotolerans]AEQ51875.1 flagellar basal-body P-ring formation protein FlgA [Pelagibacterium halotolerans B2]QJR18321.1 flagellar basal body P-ring formation protein FlgA [Pelagibacterium halotolerans]SEA25738.1 flagella basal body P-ring formation protein FlgA [Pelagibacterium halotolerans]